MIGNFQNNQNGGRTTPAMPSMVQQAFVSGIEGARAYPMLYGVNVAILWDTDQDLFYVKQVDNMGRPYIAKTCKYEDYDPEPQFSVQQPVDTTQFVTKEYFDQVLSQLIVGEKGKVVRDEPNG